MSKLEAFLHPAQGQETKEIMISNRFLDENGKPVPFVIKAISEDDNRKIRKSCTRKHRDRTGATVTDFDTDAYSARMVIAGTVEPDFASKEMCDAYGTNDPEEVPGKMLLAGEYNKLSDAIAELSGFNDDIDDEAKNS